jgi:hypothetical protein
LEKYPHLLHNIYDLDSGINFFLMGLPAWMPWLGVMKAHIGRYNAGQALDDFQRALDALANGEAVDSSWGEPDDVSDFIMERHAIYKSNSCKPPLKLNGSPMLVANANLLVYWQILFILSITGLGDRIREEVAPFATVTKPLSIGSISEAPELKLHTKAC